MNRVVPDCSFELVFPATARVAALTALAQLCTSETTGAAIDAARSRGERVTARLVLVLPCDPALAMWRAHNPEMQQGVPEGQVRLGNIDVSIEEQADEHLHINLWPVTSAMQRACLASSGLRRALVGLVAAQGGLGLYLDRGDGSVAELWPRDEVSVESLAAWIG